VKSKWTSIGAFLGALAVVTGAFGAHGLKDKLTPEALDLWHTAVLYHALHAIALVQYGLFDRDGESSFAGRSFLSGIALFSGSIYALALGAPKWAGIVTPIGGALLILGWLAFAWRARRAK
jgi:uncharacterized membrane protein YgdD (TMEM256/DUF423 family)